MKKTVLCVLGAMALMLSSCVKNDAALVKETAEKFLTAIVAGDLTTAKTLVTPATSEKWGETAEFLEMVMLPEIKAAIQSAATKVTDVKVEGETAQATVAVAIPSVVGEISILHFLKQGDQWLVNEPGVLVVNVIERNVVVMDADSTVTK